MTAAVVGLLVLRLAGNLADSGVIDVGYAGVIGADKIGDSNPIYDNSFPDDNPTGDTYGPANYFAYVPFEQIFPWSGSWDDLPAAHAASIFFDLVTVAGLFALGLALVRRRTGDRPRTTTIPTPPRPSPRGGRIRRRLATWFPDRRANVVGLTLVFAWVAYPYTAFAMQGNSNDELISALLVWSLAAFASPFARGSPAGHRDDGEVRHPAARPAVRHRRARDPPARSRATAAGMLKPMLIFTVAFALLRRPPARLPGRRPRAAEFWDRTVKSQLDRESPFSIWGQADLEWLHTLVKAGVVVLGVARGVLPVAPHLIQIAALSAALIIGVETHARAWFYLYIPWFLGRDAAGDGRPRRRRHLGRHAYPVDPYPPGDAERRRESTGPRSRRRCASAGR